MPPLNLAPVPGVAVLGAGLAHPPRLVGNADVLAWLDPGRSPARLRFAAEGLTETLGVRSRAWSRWPGDPSTDEADTVSLAVQAGRAALIDAAVAPEDVDVLLVATSTPTRWTSTTCAAVGGALGLRAMALDVRSGCAGALFALATAAGFVERGARRALVIGADTFSKAIGRGDRMAALLLADGAAALVLGPGDGGMRAACLVTDGSLGGLVHTPGPLPPTAEAVADDLYRLRGDPERLVAAVPPLYAEVIEGVLRSSGAGVEQIAWYLPQQAGRPVIDATCAAMGLPREKAIDIVGRHGNTGAASALGAFATARQEGRLQAGDDVLLASVGGGMSAGAVLWTC